MSSPASIRARQSSQDVHFSPSRVTPLMFLAISAGVVGAGDLGRQGRDHDGVVGLTGVQVVGEARVDAEQALRELVAQVGQGEVPFTPLSAPAGRSR